MNLRLNIKTSFKKLSTSSASCLSLSSQPSMVVTLSVMLAPSFNKYSAEVKMLFKALSLSFLIWMSRAVRFALPSRSGSLKLRGSIVNLATLMATLPMSQSFKKWTSTLPADVLHELA